MVALEVQMRDWEMSRWKCGDVGNLRRMCIPSVDTTSSRDGRAIELQQLHSLRCQPWFERSSLHLRL